MNDEPIPGQIIRTEVRTFTCRWICPTGCGGEMKFLGITNGDGGSLHKCDRCDHIANMTGGKTFPGLQFDPL